MKPDARPPLVTLGLVLVSLVAAVALLFAPDLADRFGFRSDAPSFLTATTSLFLHANVLHLLGNLLFLAAVGGAVEAAGGGGRLLAVFLLSGWAGVALHFAFTRHVPSPAPYIGASGGVAGLVAYYALRYQAVRVPVLPRVALPVLGITGLWFALQALGGLVRIGESGGVAFWAHLGGFAMGFLLSLLFRAPHLGDAWLAETIRTRAGDRSPLARKAAAEDRLKSAPEDPAHLRELAEACAVLGDDRTEAEARARFLRHLAPEEQPAEVERLFALGAIGQVPPRHRIAVAEGIATARPDLARRLLETVVADDPGLRPDALLSLATTFRDEAAPWLERLTREHPLSPATEIARRRGWIA